MCIGVPGQVLAVGEDIHPGWLAATNANHYP